MNDTFCMCPTLSVYVRNSAPPDPTMTVDNVTQVMDKIEGDKWEVIGGIVGNSIVPTHQLKEIQRKYSTDTEKTRACAAYFVNYHPDPSWKEFAIHMYYKKEFTAARESKSFMSTGKYCYYITYTVTTAI